MIVRRCSDMQERYSEEVKSILEAAQQQAVMNYQLDQDSTGVFDAFLTDDTCQKQNSQQDHTKQCRWKSNVQGLQKQNTDPLQSQQNSDTT